MEQTFCQELVSSASARPDKVAMVLIGPGGKETTTFSSMLAQIRSLAFRLQREQIGFGDRVALIGENHPHWVMAYHGVLFRGAVAVPLDPEASIEAMAAFLEGSEARLAFVSPRSLTKFRAVCERLGRRIPLVLLRAPRDHEPEANGYARYQDWSQTPVTEEFAAAPPPAKSDDTAVLIYTSGTTGTPKAVPLTHRNIQAESVGVEEAMRITEREIVLGLLPLFHVYSQMISLWLAPLIGARVVYISEMTSAEIEHGLKEGDVTALIGVPRLWYLFHKKIFDTVRAQPRLLRWVFNAMLAVNGWLRDRIDLNLGTIFFRRIHHGFGGKLRLAVAGGASFDADVALDFHRLGFTILQGYGLTETAGSATVTRFEDNKIGSVGTPLKGVEIRIHEPNQEGVGEVLIRGPIVTPGYYRNPEANRQSFDADGWFHTGDLGRFDREGHLYIVGRMKDVIKLPSGKNVFPEDVEAHYSRSPMVGEICVLGVRDEAVKFARAEKLCAVVVPDFDYLKTQHIANTREAIRWELDNLGRELPEYQRVRDYMIRAEPLPRTTTRKVRRYELEQQIVSAGPTTQRAREASRFTLSPDDQKLMDSTAGRATAAAIKIHAPETTLIHPEMNLELDLGLDSLARAECVASVEQTLGIEFDSTAVAEALKVGELIQLAEAMTIAAGSGAAAASLNWREIIAREPVDSTDLQPILKRKPVTALFAFLVLKLINLAARVLFRMEVDGRDLLNHLDRPYLICPNHQSFIDPLLICSTYPYRILKHVFHVGATVYFSQGFSAWIARRFNIVPVDPDVNLLRAMRAGAAGLRAGKILNLYPEGERSFDGVLHEFKKGAAILAVELNLPIVPVALDGAYLVWGRKSGRIRLAGVKIRFGEPIFIEKDGLTEISGEPAYQEVTDLIKERIQQMLDQMRKD